MAVNVENYKSIKRELGDQVTLVAVSKTKPVEDIKILYDLGHRDFGENYVQELAEKQPRLPQDIRWHYIGHLQSNKVKYIAPFVHLVHGVDSLRLLKEINKQAQKNNRVIDCLLQVHIAREETKFGLDENELQELCGMNEAAEWSSVQITGLMGMASFTEDMNKVRAEFRHLKILFDKCRQLKIQSRSGGEMKFRVLSMGMSSDYKIAVEEGSNMVRVGSLIFGERN
jgi:pyridoxal phosphate enzyme (YggS family)